MMGVQNERSPRGGASFDADQQIGLVQRLYGDAERNARDGYRGTSAPTTEPPPRHFADIGRELADAATRLRAIAGGIRLSGPTPEAVTDADRTVTGCGRLIAELRQAQA